MTGFEVQGQIFFSNVNFIPNISIHPLTVGSIKVGVLLKHEPKCFDK